MAVLVRRGKRTGKGPTWTEDGVEASTTRKKDIPRLKRLLWEEMEKAMAKAAAAVEFYHMNAGMINNIYKVLKGWEHDNRRT